MLLRRNFLRQLTSCGLLGLGAAVVPASALAARTTPTPTRTPTARPSPSPSPSPSPTVAPRPTATPTPAPQAWVQALNSIPLWSGPDDNAEQFGFAARWDYFLIARPQDGPRLFVLVARTNNYAWVDALSVGPSGPPPPGWPTADLPTPPQDVSLGWVATVTDAALWADANSNLFLGLAPAYTALKQLDPQNGPRLHVQDPY